MVIRFSVLSAVGDSCQGPLAYFDNNISGTILRWRAHNDILPTPAVGEAG